ncbi:monosaccharide transporter [Basidiobolus meristosporus CBS 931.73]|uniref:Monosaccharide transporter n=2 Tax=Basidiobolus meristosporus CBS 931.73 TaxID=1314790 RepID=A0A1Y1YPV9_9FUNG|nr:monosaccharide transporter [Basidiobolus meristosporus CBS 931.73]ORY00054.1 monosaccharide transporter [Basidiobolus meristosporus CBS 931.73]|eukprot:ORY00052.1 monosaccharide transporter [Basidiobolus meristosporus CBS 931.73]
MDSSASEERRSPNDSRNVSYPPFALFCTLVACIVMFSSGFTTSSTNITSDSIRNCPTNNVKLDGRFPHCFDMGSWLWGFAVGNSALGGTFGCMLAGYTQEKYGRRLAMIGNNFFFVLGGLLMGMSINPGMWICGRFLIGFACGHGAVILPTYIGEVAPIKTRGTFGTCNQFNTVIGILVVECMSLGMATSVGWRVLVALVGAFGLVQAILMPMCVETPRYLVSMNRNEEAKASLQKLRGNADIEIEFQEILQAREEAKNLPKNLSVMEIIKDKHCTLPFIICIGLGALQQWSGINGIMYYCTSIFGEIYHEKAKYVTVGLMGLNVFMTIVSVVLVDRSGRKFLLLLSSGGSAIFNILMCVGLEVHNDGLTVASIFIFVAFFAVGLGPVPFLIMTELMPTNAVSATSSTALAINWLSNFVIGLIFPAVSDAINGYIFLIFAGCCAVGFVGILFFVRETKGKSIEELTARHRGGEELNGAKQKN